MLKLNEVESLNQRVADLYAATGSNAETVTLPIKLVEDALECIIWTEAQLKQRQINSRSYLTRTKIKDRLLKEHLSPDELRSIEEQARKAAEDSLGR